MVEKFVAEETSSLKGTEGKKKPTTEVKAPVKKKK